MSGVDFWKFLSEWERFSKIRSLIMLYSKFGTAPTIEGNLSILRQIPTEHATTPKSTTCRNSNSSYKFKLNQELNLNFYREIPRNLSFSIWWLRGNTLHLTTTTHCKTLQYTATQFHTLPHTATHYNTLQHAATPCNTLPHPATHSNTPERAKITATAAASL